MGWAHAPRDEGPRLLRLDQLHQDPFRRFRVQEGHLVATSAGPGLGVDEPEALVGQAGQGPGEVGDPVGDVVKAGSPPGQESPDGGVGSQGLEDFQGAHEADPDSLVMELLHRGTRIPGEEFIDGNDLFERGNGHGDVVQRMREHFVSVPA